MAKTIERRKLIDIFERMNEINKRKPSEEELNELVKVLNEPQEKIDEDE